MNTFTQRINDLRQSMKSQSIDAMIIPRTDAHLSEYISDHWHVVRFLSGFTGSAATMVVTLDKALLWTDSRYFLQAAQQLADTGIELMKEGLPDTPDISSWLCQNLHKGNTVGIDGMTMSIDGCAALAESLAAKGINIRVDFSPIDTIWTDRPSLPADKIFVHDIKYAGEDAKSKISRVLANVAQSGASTAFLSALDEIAWTLNIRSNDVPDNPVATSFLYLSPKGSTIFVDPVKMTPEVEAYLKAADVQVMPYTAVKSFLGTLANDEKMLMSATQNAVELAHIAGDRVVKGKSPVAMLKAVKNDIQLAGTREAMKRDGVALVYSFMEIENRLASGAKLTEMDVAEILTRRRSEQPLYFEDSFATIAGFGAHGAIVHYTADEQSNAEIKGDNLLLIDSGANYIDGTTDITRTIAIGTPTAEMKHDFTRVMQGHIAISTAVFPAGTRGHQLDAMARMPLWKEGKSYLHGTGHGVGHFLNVHEGPQSIRLNDTMAPMLPGMITSNEPGIYLSDRYGIRCENLVLTVPKMTTEFGDFYAFEELTLFPFDLRLFDTSIMSDEEIAWVNDYHATVRERLTPMLDAEGAAWLEEKTRPLER